MGFLQFLRIFWARRALIITTTLACLVGALLLTRILPARYTATSRVMLDLVKPDPVTGQVIASQFARAYVKTQTELITDYRVAGKAADSLGWTNNAGWAARYQSRSRNDKRDFRRWLADLIIQGTNASLLEGSNILEIGYTSTSPEQSRKVADAVRQAYIDQVLAFRRDDAGRNAQWFSEQAERIKAALTQAETRKADFERANGIVLQDDNTDAESARLKALAASSAAPPTVTSGGAPVAAGPTNAPQLAEANAALANAARTLGPNHPEYQRLKQARDAIAASGGAPRMIQSRPTVSGPSIASQFAAQQAKVLAQRGKVGEAQQLAADVTVLRDQYNKTSARAADLAQQGETSESGVTLLASAVAPSTPTFPNYYVIIPGSIALGGALGILASLLTELLSRRVRGAEDLRLAEIPVLAIMARDRRTEPRRSLLGWLGFRGRSTPATSS